MSGPEIAEGFPNLQWLKLHLWQDVSNEDEDGSEDVSGSEDENVHIIFLEGADPLPPGQHSYEIEEHLLPKLPKLTTVKLEISGTHEANDEGREDEEPDFEVSYTFAIIRDGGRANACQLDS